jgi:hypothetical protein
MTLARQDTISSVHLIPVQCLSMNGKKPLQVWLSINGEETTASVALYKMGRNYCKCG